jgi:hypothetical protein
VRGGGECPEDFDALVLVPAGGGLRDPEALAEAGEARPVAEPGEDEDGLLVAGQGRGFRSWCRVPSGVSSGGSKP